MAISGVGSVFGIGQESTWGTAVTITRHLPFLSEDIRLSTSRVRGRSLSATRKLPSNTDSRIGATDVAGNVEMLMFDSAMGILLEACLGASQTTGAGPYTHTFTPASLSDDPLTLKFGYGGSSSVPTKQVEGAMVDSWEIALRTGELATMSIGFVGEAMTTSNSDSVAGSQPADMLPFFYTESAITVSEVGGSSITTNCITDFRLSAQNNLRSDLRCLGSSTITQPIEEQLRTYECRLGIRMDTWTNILHDAYVADTHVEIANVLTHASSGHTLTITVQGKLAGETAVVSGPEVVEVTVPLEIESDTDANSVTIVAVNDDSAI